MKYIYLLWLTFTTAYYSQAQNSEFVYRGRYYPSIQHEQVLSANTIFDIMPKFNSNFTISGNDNFHLRKVLNNQKMVSFPLEDYTQVLDIISIVLEIVEDGKSKQYTSKSIILTNELKYFLHHTDLFSDIKINILFNYKNTASYLNTPNKPKTGVYIATIAPSEEAAFPGGFTKLSMYYQQQLMNKLPAKALRKIKTARVTFTINENGNVENSKIAESTRDASLDKLILDVTNKMPKWKPAVTNKGTRIKQAFSIPFWEGC